MMTRGVILFLSLAFSLLGFSKTSFGQRVTISTWSGSDDIIVRSVGMGENTLNFNKNLNVITANSGPIQIRKEDENTAIFAIEAPSEFEIAITMDYYPFLTRDEYSSIENSIPIVFYMSYNNQNAANEIDAKDESIDLIRGITSITIPVNSKFNSNQLTSDPVYAMQSEKPKSVVYLFIYGTLGPVGSVDAGNYDTQLSINVNEAN